MKKTVKDLTLEIKDKHESHIEEMMQLEAEREAAIRDDKFLNDAKALKACYDAHIEAGFTEEQAWEIITIMLSK